MSNLYIVLYGVDSRHLTESGGVSPRLRDAIRVYNDLPMPYPFKAKRLQRLEFSVPLAPATKVVTLKEVQV